MATVGAVWINVLPSMQGFASNLQKQATSAAKVAGVRPGQAMGASLADEVGKTVNRRMPTQAKLMADTFGRSTTAMTRSLSNFRAGFASVDAAASAFTGRMGTLGGVTQRAVAPGVAAVGRFAGGFADAQVAASAFSGRMGTLGGMAGRALAPGVDAVGRLHDGFTNSAAAVSAFSGRMGSLGGLARTALQPGITAARGIGAAMASAGGVATGALGRIRTGASKAFGAVRTGFTTLRANAAESATAAGGVGSALTRMGAIGAAAVSAIGLGALGKSALSTAADIQQSTASMAGLYGETSLAEDMMRRLRDYSRDTPLETQSLYNAGENLAYLGLQGEEAMGVIENVGAALMASGNTSGEAMSNVTQAILSMQSAGQLYAADIQRISDENIPVWDMMSAHMGKSVKDVRADVTAGKLDVEDFIEVIQAGDGDIFEMMRAGADETNKTFRSQFAQVKDNVQQTLGETLLPLVDRAAPAMGRLGESIEGGMQALPGIMSSVASAVRDAGLVEGFRSLVAGARDFGAAAMPAITAFGQVVGGAFLGALQVMRPLGALLQHMAGWMRENESVVKILGAALGGAALAMAVMRTATVAWTVAQWALNAALVNNPVGWIIAGIVALAAAVVYAYKNFEGFRNVIDAVWQAVKTAALWIWDRGLKPAFDGISDGLSWIGGALATAGGWFVSLGQAAMGLWESYIRPAFDFIWSLVKNVITGIIVVLILPAVAVLKVLGAAAMWLWTNAIQPAFQAIGALATWLWQNAIQPAFQAIGALATWLWNNAIKPAFEAAQAGIRALAAVFQWLWANIVQPVFQFIGRAIAAWWSGAKAIFQAVINFVRGPLGSIFRWFRDSVIKPVWSAISTTINSVWTNGIKPAFDKVREGVRAMQRAFNAGKKSISRAWEGIRDSAKKPINFLIGTVFNKGIRPIWNKVAGIVGADKVDTVDTFATGGVLPGYTPGRDVHLFTSPSGGALALSGGEAIMRPEVTRAMGTDGVEQLNAAARAGGVSGVRDVLGYARGGVLGNPSRFARGGWLGVDDISPPTDGIIGAAAKFVKDIAVDVFTGDLGGAVDTFFEPAKTATKRFGTEGFPGAPYQMVDKFNTSMKEKIEGFLDFFTGDGGGEFASVGKGKAGDVVRLARSTIGKYPESNGNNTNAITNWYGMNGAPWCAMYISWLFNQARASGSLGRAARTAWTGDYYGSGMRRVGAGSREPGDVVVYGTQHVNMYDGNGYTIGGNESNNVRRSRGYVGRGAAFRPAWKAATGGILDRQSMRRIALQDPRDADTEIGRSMRGLYDRGGYVQPGTTLVTNKTGGPEPVLTQAQWQDMHRLAESVGAGEGGDLMRDAHIHLHEANATVREAFRSVDTELRKRRRGGVHAGRTGR